MIDKVSPCIIARLENYSEWYIERTEYQQQSLRTLVLQKQQQYMHLKRCMRLIKSELTHFLTEKT